MVIAFVVVVICFLVLAYTFYKELQWSAAIRVWDAHHDPLLAQVIITTAGVTSHKFKRAGPNITFHTVAEGEAGAHPKDVFLNYSTLVDMVMVEQEQRELLLKAIDDLRVWEELNPQPQRPFGKLLT